MFLPIWAAFGFFGFGFGRLLLRHQRADLLGDTIAGGFPLARPAPANCGVPRQNEDLVNFGFVPRAARGQPLADQIGLFANQFDIKHRPRCNVIFASTTTC
jgi:hypothetical protein